MSGHAYPKGMDLSISLPACVQTDQPKLGEKDSPQRPLKPLKPGLWLPKSLCLVEDLFLNVPAAVCAFPHPDKSLSSVAHSVLLLFAVCKISLPLPVSLQIFPAF